MTATIVASKNIWFSSLLAFAGSMIFLYSGLCQRILGNSCEINDWYQQKNESISQQRFYHEDYEKYLNVFVIHHSITGKWVT